MRIVLYIVILLLTSFAPIDRLDIAKLEPVEAVAVYRNEDYIILETDTKAVGKGETVEEALENMKENTTAVIYLDTAEYLLVEPRCQDAVEALMPYLKPAVKVASYTGGDIAEAAKYLDAHWEKSRPEN